MFELKSRTSVQALQCQQAYFSLPFCLFMVLYTPSSPPPFTLWAQFPTGNISHFPPIFSFLLEVEWIKVWRIAVKTVNAQRKKAKCKSSREGGKQKRLEGEPEMMYNRDNTEVKMGKCKDILFCYNESFAMFLKVPGSFTCTVRNDTNCFSQTQSHARHTHTSIL